MKTSRYSDSQLLAILKQNEPGAKVAALCREHGMSVLTAGRLTFSFLLLKVAHIRGFKITQIKRTASQHQAGQS